MIHVRAENSNGTTVGKFSIFNLLRGGFTLLPSFRSLPHYALLIESSVVTVEDGIMHALKVSALSTRNRYDIAQMH